MKHREFGSVSQDAIVKSARRFLKEVIGGENFHNFMDEIKMCSDQKKDMNIILVTLQTLSYCFDGVPSFQFISVKIKNMVDIYINTLTKESKQDPIAGNFIMMMNDISEQLKLFCDKMNEVFGDEFEEEVKNLH